jgi:putative hydrolase of the HAD superfamily
MSIRTIVFDFGNVVGFFDNGRILKRIAGHTDLSTQEIRDYLVGSQLEDDYEANRLSTAQFVRRVMEELRLRCSPEELIAAYVDIFWQNPDVCDVIPRLKPRFRLLLGSNTTELHSRHFCKQFESTLAHFNDLVLSWEVGARKPGAAFFERCVSLADCAPGEILFVDDLPANVEGARACGLQGLVYRGKDIRRELARHGILTGDDIAAG